VHAHDFSALKNYFQAYFRVQVGAETAPPWRGARPTMILHCKRTRPGAIDAD